MKITGFTFAALPLFALISLSACDSTAKDAASTETAAAATQAPPPAPMPTTIPAAFQGRWGINSADCEAGRADAKGLLTISDTTLTFYESVGTLSDVTEASGTRLRGNYDFTGEGMTWKRDEVLDLRDSGQTLVRREFGEDALPGPFSYTKCA
ncbi:MAG: hypothetical protein ABIT16_09710 [Croceibacterium sp.]